MTIKNADVPAIPATGNGMTKREMMAMHMMAACRTRYTNYKSWVEMATDAIEMTDALLAELERTK